MTKKIIPIIVVIALALMQCRNDKRSAILDASQLAAQIFSIDITKDTVIHTRNGAMIRIPQGTLVVDGTQIVNLEIKEAYTIADIVAGGLTTKAGKDLLSSGGMVYVNAVEGGVKIAKPLSVSIPTSYQQQGMTLYKGEKKPDGTIDWTDPQPLPKQELPDRLAAGKILFSTCASCHDPVKNRTGPALAFLDKRRNLDWLKRFINNSAKMIASGDQLANCIYNLYNKTAMTAYPTLREDDVSKIFEYADYEAENTPHHTFADFKKAFDSCMRYTKMLKQISEKRDSLIIENGPQVAIKAVNPLSLAPENGPGSKPDDIVRAAKNDAVYYQFNITTFGWYNVDILFRDMPGFENSILTVRAIGEYKDDINIYLVIPTYKVFVPGGPMADKPDEYAFFTDDGKAPLPQNANAWIIAFGEYNGQVFFGKTEFVTSQHQSFEIQLKGMAREQMNAEVKKLGIPDLDITAVEAKNSGEIRKIDATLIEIEKFKPKDCDCDCLSKKDSGFVR